MLDKLKQFLQRELLSDDDTGDVAHVSVKLAAAALMVEVIAADYHFKDEEREMLLNILQKRFSLDKNAAESLLQEAEQAHKSATDYFAFTSEINRRFSQKKKIELIHILWQLANADNEIHQIEQHVIRRISNLLHVEHSDFIAAKLAATGHT
ncbi:TerB family tellurite resistance protein [Methylophaga sp.]|uniref:tellurite resistance TerB family protein n=1 Tax=Methylophaga sp. TaxID=2024840 RepID=UPI00271A90B9|nr:TerB family tellurite resistance protein [Methylophaga sp.]MDO8825795.1 TerB family tellurite resistance protein [Methylophaga sp.]